jgi:hypothetical protein
VPDDDTSVLIGTVVETERGLNMDYLDIDEQLAKTLGYTKFEHDIFIENGEEQAALMVPDALHEWKYFRPTADIRDAWDVAEAFEFYKLEKSCDGYYGAFLAHTRQAEAVAWEKTPEMAICQAALKIIKELNANGPEKS